MIKQFVAMVIPPEINDIMVRIIMPTISAIGSISFFGSVIIVLSKCDCDGNLCGF